METSSVLELAPEATETIPDLSRFETFRQITYKPVSPTARAAKHVYGVEPTGTLRHISHDAVLAYFGYGGYMTPEQDYRSRLSAEDQIAAVEAEAVEAAAAAVAALPPRAEAEPDPQGRQWLLRSSIAVASMPARLAAAYRNPETRRRNILLTAGAVAVGALIGFGAYRFGFAASPPHGPLADPGSLPPHPPLPNHDYAQLPPVQSAPIRVHAPRRPPQGLAVERLPAYNARTGAGTIWGGVKQLAANLGYDRLKAPALRRLTQATLNLNHLSWREARHLPKGFPVRMLSKTALSELLQ